MTQPGVLLFIVTGLKRDSLQHELHPEDQVLTLEWEQPQMHQRYKGIRLPTLPNQAPMFSTALKMFSSATGHHQVSSTLDRLDGDEQLDGYSWRFHSTPEKDAHVSRDSKTDRISDTSSSSYHTAPGSEEAESAKDCTEYLEEAEDLTGPCTYCGSEYEQRSPVVIPIFSGAQTSPADRSKISRVTGSQPQGTLNGSGYVLEEGLFSTNGPGESGPYAVTSGRVKACFPPQGTETTLGGSLPFQEVRGQTLQADCDGAIKDQTCRDKLCSSGQKNQQVQMSIKAKNSSDPAYSGRMGPGTRRLQPRDNGSQCLAHTAQISSDKLKERLPGAHKQKKSTLGSHMRSLVSNKTACPQYFVENPSVLSDSDETDSEVEKLTALSFQSLSPPQGSYLDMYTSSNGTSPSLSSSLPEECNGINGWAACSDPKQTVVVGHSKGSWPFLGASKASKTELLGGVLGKDHLECTSVMPENASGKKSLSKKRVVPKRQIQLRRKEKKETGFCDAGNCAVLQPFAQPRKEPCAKGRCISDEFRINYKQFLKAASLSSDYNNTRLASSLVKNVLAKKMQYEQKIKMEQASIQGSSTSSAPSSVTTDLQGESLEGKASSLSKSDCSCSTEDVQSHSTTSERSESVAVRKECMDALRPTKGVVLNGQLKEKVCKLKNTFNELNERMKSQEATLLKKLPILAESGMNMTESDNIRKKASGERKEYRRARAVFESMEADARRSVVVPKFTKPQKPWPNLKQRAICQNKYIQPKEETFPFNPKGLLVPRDTSQNIFTSKTKEMKLIPQLNGEHNVLHAFKYNSLDRTSRERRLPTFQTMKLSSVKLPASGTAPSGEKPSCSKTSCPEGTTQVENKGTIRIHQPRSVRKLVNNPYSPAFKSSANSSIDQPSYSEIKSDNSLTVSPLFIRCTSVCRKEDPQSHMREEKQEQTGNISASTLSLRNSNASGRESVNNNDHPSVQSQGSMSVCPPLGESVVNVTSIQSKKLVVEDEKLQPQVENKPMSFKRSELHVRPPSTTKKESQLNVRVNSSLSKPLHKTETDYFPASSCSALGEGTMEEALLPSHHSLSQENKATASSEAILTPPSTYLQEITKRAHGCAAPSHTQKYCQTQDAELSYQKHYSSKRLPVIRRDSQGSSHYLKEENTFFEPLSSCGSCRQLQVNRPPMTITQNIQTQSPRHHHFLDSASEMTAPERYRSLEGHNRTQPECLISDNPLTTREYTEGIKLISSSSFTPSTSCSSNSGCDYPKNKHQATNEQYFAATQADNANYLTIPMKAHQLEAAAKYPVSLGTENPSFPSSVSFQPGGEASGNKINSEFLLPKQMERKAPSDNLVYGNPAHGPLPLRHEESPIFAKRIDRTSPPTKSAPSPTRPFAAPPLQGHRRMLVDPESGKCYYVEPPRQPQLKMLYDPETGQYIEVLIPPVPLAPPSGHFPSPFSPAVMNTGSYAPPYVSYSPFQGFPPPPPPALPVHPDFHHPPTAQENGNFSEGFNHFSKNETPQAGQSADSNYMDSLCYTPTGMNSSPNPNPFLYSPFTNSSLSVPERGSFVRM